MSTYMSQSLKEKINIDLLENNFISLSINEENFKIIEIEIFHEKILLSFNTKTNQAYDFLSKNFNIKDFKLNWSHKKELMSYEVLSLIHKLDNNVDTYIIKLQVNLEV